MGFLPVKKDELDGAPDFVYVIGDAYVDHSSFGPAIISRVLTSMGYTVAIIAQPDWKRDESVTEFGCPRLAFIISAGNMDSMVNHYTVNKKRRSMDAYSPGGKQGLRPDHAVVVYSNLVRRVYRDVPIIIGGIEASLRRMGHYDYWSDSIKRSVLLDSGADLLSYGMGERSLVEIAQALESGIAVSDITFIRGTVYRSRTTEQAVDAIHLPPFSRIKADPREYAASFGIQYANTDPYSARTLIEEYDHGVFVIQNPPALPLTRQEMDDVYSLPYMNRAHPMYDSQGGIPALEEVKFSLTHCRGCFGGCSFCSLTFHQGRIIQSRSIESVVEEARGMTRDPDFKGYIHDVGGPTANFRHRACAKQEKSGACKDRQCLFPAPCRNLKVDHSEYLKLLRKLRELPGVKKVFVRSGIRYDYLMADEDDTFFRELVAHHISGQLRVAPEHVSDRVLEKMGKPRTQIYNRFLLKYEELTRRAGKKQFAVPYLMSSHPGSRMEDAIALAEYVRDLGYMPEQVQDFYPTPSTLSTVMYCTGLDPRDMSEVYVERDPARKAMQRALIQYRRPENHEQVKRALIESGRTDLIGYGKECLIPPRPFKKKDKGGRDEQSAGRKQSRPGRAGQQGRSLSGHPGRDRNKSKGVSGRRSGRSDKV